MKLNRVDKLMATLAMQIIDTQLDQMISRSTDFGEWEKDDITAPIDLLDKLKKKRSSDALFLESLEELLQGVDDAEGLVIAVRECREENAIVDDENSIRLPYSCTPHRPSKQQRVTFMKTLSEIRKALNRHDFKIIKALSKVPERCKDTPDNGYGLFNAMINRGCISENDVELLEDILTHLSLTKPLNLLRGYQEQWIRRPSVPRDQQISAPTPPPLPPPPPPQMPQYSHPPQSTSWPLEYHTLSSHHTGRPIQDDNPPSSSPYQRSPGYRVDTYPRLNPPAMTTPLHPTSSYHPPTTTPPHPSHPHTGHQPPPSTTHSSSQASAPVAASETLRGVSEHLSMSNPLQTESASEPGDRPPPLNPAFNLFQQQQSIGSPSNTLSRQPSVSQSHATSHSIQSPPPVHPQPSVSNSQPPPLPTAPPAILSSSSTPHEPSEAATFAEPQTCQSLGNRSDYPSRQTRSPVVHGGRYSPIRVSSSHGCDRKSQSLPTADAGGHKLLGKRSREMDELPHCDVRQEAPPHWHPQRSVVDVGMNVGGGGRELPSINASVIENTLNNQSGDAHPGASSAHPGSSDTHPRPSPANPGELVACPRTSPAHPGPSAAHPRPRNDHLIYSSSASQSSELDDHPLSYPSTPAHLSQSSAFVSGRTSSSGSSNNSSYSQLSNPHDSLNHSQFVSHHASYASTSFPHSPVLSPRGMPGGYSHDPSTHSLVNRQLFRESSHGTPSGGQGERGSSSSLVPIPEEHVQNRDENDDSNEGGVPAASRKRTLKAEDTSDEGESGGDTKRVRTEKPSKSHGGVGAVLRRLPLIGRFYQSKQQESESDSDEFEDAQEN